MVREVEQLAAQRAHNPQVGGSNPSLASRGEQVNSDYISMSQAATLLPNRPSSGTIWRWCRRGIRSAAGDVIKLRHVRFGKRLYTRADWVAEFGEQLAEADQNEERSVVRRPATSVVTKSHAMADAELREAGL